MSFYVYIIQSLKDGSYYKGSTQNPAKRLSDHNLGMAKYTSTKGPWKLVYVEQLHSKKEMLIREKKLKRGNAKYYSKLINSEKNQVIRFT